MDGKGASFFLSNNPQFSLSRQQKVILMLLSVSVAAVTIMSRYFRRPTRGRIGSNPAVSNPLLGKTTNARNNFRRRVDSESTTASLGVSPRLNQTHSRTSTTSSILTQSTIVSNSAIDIGNLTCTQLGVLGLETLEKSISFWEESLQLLRDEKHSLDREDEAHCMRTIQQLEKILEAAYNLQHLSEELYLDEGSALYADVDSSEHMSFSRGRLRSASSIESFMSAEDFLSDDEEIRQSLETAGIVPGETYGDGTFPLFEAALRLVCGGSVPYRTLKTDMVGCTSGDHEYLAKLHCLRGAFSRVISDPTKRQWISVNGKDVFSQILIKANKDPSEFEKSFDAIILWSQEPGNWGILESELKDRGLRAMTFYDIVIDYILLDAFEDLEAPPASVLAVTQNRWLSNSFKENALGTAVWSVLKTKRKWLRYPDGFMSHFYTLSEHIMPTLAWGFLGPQTLIQELCIHFKDKFLEFLNSIYSFEEVRYTNLDDLSEDVMKKLEHMHSLIISRITSVGDDT